jgi:hypothetical protein
MSDFYDSLEPNEPAKAITEQAAEFAQELRNKQEAINNATKVLKAATDDYNHLAHDIIPDYYKANGISKMCLEDGTIISIDEKLTCSPTKGMSDKLAEWLRANGGGDLVKSKLETESSYADKLTSLGIPFVESTTVNTNSLKSWLKDALGKSGSVARLEYKDIPDFVNLFIYNDTKIVIKEI